MGNSANGRVVRGETESYAPLSTHQLVRRSNPGRSCHGEIAVGNSLSLVICPSRAPTRPVVISEVTLSWLLWTGEDVSREERFHCFPNVKSPYFRISLQKVGRVRKRGLCKSSRTDNSPLVTFSTFSFPGVPEEDRTGRK